MSKSSLDPRPLDRPFGCREVQEVRERPLDRTSGCREVQEVRERPVLYSFRRCPYAIRARWTLLVTGQSVILREIKLQDKPAEMLRLSPKGTVPVLLLPSGEILQESVDIMRWALLQNDPENWMRGEQGDAAEMNRLVFRNDHEFKPHLDRYKYATRYEGADPKYHRDQAEDLLRDLEARLQNNPFLFGSRRSFADIAILPFIRQFVNTDKAWFESTAYASTRTWFQGLVSGDDFSTVMTKYELYRPEHEDCFFPLP